MEWPDQLDFRKFPNGMISGLSIEEIDRIYSNPVTSAFYDEENNEEFLGITEDLFTLSNIQSNPSTSTIIMNDEQSNQCTSSTSFTRDVHREIRFSAPVTSTDIRRKKECLIPKGTQKRDRWALNLFMTWKKYRQDHILKEEIHMKEVLEKSLSRNSMSRK